ncbi:hypothetical protein K5I29_12425 [Flavobacterium agricola]|uniref:Carboxypeptidase-like protein n=1 Tax=Flavobacterium agricola TaxID=2870839 RepID=A0ABY6M0P1_9FLAO|nr:hypothetical protein [Flavobacterium agricola]UYW01239.1 hypothetical protein K5I29_12425 [Flavobacterium agricola]
MFSNCALYAQQNTRLKGIVSNHQNTLEQVLVTNRNNQNSSISNRLGKFSVAAQVNDTLVFTHTEHAPKQLIITAKNLEEDELLIILKPNFTLLDEVKINTKANVALELGILQKPAKEYTKSERLLKAASEMEVSTTGGVMGGGVGMSLDPIINAITGRTKMLKKVIEKEGNNRIFNRIKSNYDTYLQEELLLTQDATRHAFISYLSGIENIDRYLFSANDEANLFYIKQLYLQQFLPHYKAE